MITKLDLGLVHGSCVDFDGKSILAIGPSGVGKSSLALQLIALGGVLVADDQVVLSSGEKGVFVSTPQNIHGQIEVRGVGLLKCPNLDKSQLNLVVDMTLEQTKRLPDPKTVAIGSHHINFIAGKDVQNLPIAAKILNLFGYSQLMDTLK
ncbi:serine kinase [Amylibacter sp. SFDW26]|uniref:HPr kinase/phosphorylase n=1 Tax=Amylibacter sp. SFDW26 TaxID=2652722 RepID=UPI0012619DB0|nr:HPr kinase/phosphatase C-terminal domain-containing protein [Amylibacter sp. SFDW26]KAB7614819.1 serine kinase [Amylibacter sp. SFDW26]